MHGMSNFEKVEHRKPVITVFEFSAALEIQHRAFSVRCSQHPPSSFFKAAHKKIFKFIEHPLSFLTVAFSLKSQAGAITSS